MVVTKARPITANEVDEIASLLDGISAASEPLLQMKQIDINGLLPSRLGALMVYTVSEEEADGSVTVTDVIAPRNQEITPGMEVVFEGSTSTLFQTSGELAEGGVQATFRLAEEIVPFSWTGDV